MKLTTIARFLCFNARAVEEIGRCKGAIWVGVWLTLLAAVARDYDGIYLVAQPYHLGVPLLASWVMGTLLWLFLRCFPRAPKRRLPYGTFLTYFWMTAPLAIIYAIPVERMMSPLGAAQANMWFLAIVAAWRVLLITSIVSYYESSSFFKNLVKVLFIADTVVLAVLMYTPFPILNIMGGIQLSERDQYLAGVVFLVRILGTLLWVLLCTLVFAMFVAEATEWFSAKRNKEPQDDDDTPPASFDSVNQSTADIKVAPSVWWALGLCSLLAIPLLAWGQPAQGRRYQVERLLLTGKLTEGLELLSQYKAEELPPHWTPPPAIGWPDVIPHPFDLALAALEADVSPSVRKMCFGKVQDFLGSSYRSNHNWENLEEHRLIQALTILESDDLLEPKFIESGHEALPYFYTHCKDSRKAVLHEYLSRHGLLPEVPPKD